MKNFIALSLAAISLAACDALPQPGEKITFSQMEAETKSRPYECSGYDAVSDTCEAIGRTVPRGRVFFAEAQTVFDVDGDLVTIRFFGTGTERNGMSCTSPDDYAIEEVGSKTEFGNFLVGTMTTVITVLGEVCGTHYHQPDGGYMVIYTDGTGRPLPGLTDTWYHFADSKKLRVIRE